jgi:uncharacterized protein involved in outer membrane biogenesis
MSETRPPRRRLRLALFVLAGVVSIPVAAAAALFATFDADHYKPEIVAALRRATGRDVSAGDIKLSLTPGLTLEAHDAALGNIPNGTRPDMATMQRIEADVAFWPLLRGHVVIRRLVLIHPDILLETDTEGHPNWRFRRNSSVANLAGEIAKRAHGSGFDIQSVHIADGTLTYRNGRTGETREVGLKNLELAEPTPDAPMTVAGEVVYGADRIAVSGRFGPLGQLRQQAAAAPWPVQFSLAGRGLQVSAVGSFTDPRHGRGYTMRVNGRAQDLGRLAALLPDPKLLPALHDVSFDLQVNDVGGAWPEPSAVVVHAGPSDLDATVPGLKVAALDISAPSFDRPIELGLRGTYRGAPLDVAARLGAPVTMLHGITGNAFPLELQAEVAGATFQAASRGDASGQPGGQHVELRAKIPDLAALSPLLHRPLPPLHNLAVEGEFSPRGNSFFDGAIVQGLKLTMPQADLTGGAVLVLGDTRPMLHATLSATHIDADAISAVTGAGLAAMAPTTSTAPASPPAPERTQPAAARIGPDSPRLFSDAKLPIDRFRQDDAEMKMTVGQLLLGGIQYRNIVAHFRLTNGHLHVAPLEGLAPSGPFDIYFDYNPNQPRLPLVFAAHSRGLALKPLLQAFGLPGDDSGTLEIEADLKSFGDTPRTLASQLSGYLGLGLVNGTVDNRLLAAPLNTLLHHARLPATVGGKSGHSDVRCFAMRADANRGQVALRAFVLDMTHFHVSATGNVDLGNEMLALRSRPMLKFMGGGVVVPVRIDGPLAAPRAQPDPDAAAAAAALAPKLGLAIDSASPTAETDPTNCDAALALARGAPDVALAPPPAPAAAPVRVRHERKLTGRNLLRRLLR